MVNITTFTIKAIKEKSARYDIAKYVKTPMDAFNLFNEVFEVDNEVEEVMLLATLNIKNMVTGVFGVSRGSLNSSIVHPREIFKRALVNNAASIIVCHNHPSGDVTPSQEDIAVTKRLVEAGKIIGIDVIDHVIIGSCGGYVSLKEKCII